MQEWQKQLSGSVVRVEDLPFLPGSIEYLEKLKNLGFDGTLDYESDLEDEKWLDKF